METKTDSFLQETLEFWQTRTRRVLTLEDAREIAENIGSFFEILLASEAERQGKLDGLAVKS
jgi:hypothetical protein